MAARRSVLLVAALVVAMVTASASVATGDGPASTDPASDTPEDRLLVVVRNGVGPLADVVDGILGDLVEDRAPPVLARLLTAVLRDRVAALHDGLRSFVLDGVSGAAAGALATHPAVASVEADRALSLARIPTGVDRVDADRLPAAGLGTGRDVDADVAVIDTGVDPRHPDLRVRAAWECSFDGCRRGGSDRDGHGTHVAGIVAARDDGTGPVGVAPGARVWSLKVLDGLDGVGSVSRVLAALDLVAEHADQVDVVNISLSGLGRSAALDGAIRRLTEAGVTVVVAAGNLGRDASDVTPANAPEALTVSAIIDTDGRPGGRGGDSCGPDDRLAGWSNTGPVVEVAAPGGCITSLAPDGGTESMSGTSMAAPHVAGAAAQYVAIHDLEGPARARAVRTRMLAGWTTAQHGPCGFAGGVSDEPLLLLASCRPATETPDRPAPPAPTPDPPPPPPPPPRPVPSATVEAVDLEVRTQLLLFRAVLGTLTLAVDDGAVDGALVQTELLRDGRVVERDRAHADEEGTVEVRFGGVQDGCHQLRVGTVTVAGHVLRPATPTNRVCVD